MVIRRSGFSAASPPATTPRTVHSLTNSKTRLLISLDGVKGAMQSLPLTATSQFGAYIDCPKVELRNAETRNDCAFPPPPPPFAAAKLFPRYNLSETTSILVLLCLDNIPQGVCNGQPLLQILQQARQFPRPRSSCWRIRANPVLGPRPTKDNHQFAWETAGRRQWRE